MNRDEFTKVQAEYEATGFPGLCNRASSECSPDKLATKIWSQRLKGGASAVGIGGGEDEEIYLYCDFHAPRNATDLNPVLKPEGAELRPEKLEDTVSSLRGPGLARLRARLSGRFGIRFNSADFSGELPSAIPQIVRQTLDASPENPYIVEFDQFILDPFTGTGQFDLVERDASDELEFDDDDSVIDGGESQVTIATKSGFADGITTGNWSHLRKVITSDKIYSVVCVPGTTGDGIFSIRVQELYSTGPVPTEE